MSEEVATIALFVAGLFMLIAIGSFAPAWTRYLHYYYSSDEPARFDRRFHIRRCVIALVATGIAILILVWALFVSLS